MTNRQKQFRVLLRECPNGLTAQQISELTNCEIKATYRRLKDMADTYIIGWTGGRPRALWAVVIPPEDCPRPEKQTRTLKDYARRDMKRNQNATT
jgi:hypothetical protein